MDQPIVAILTAALVVFMLQIITGIMLAFIYVPSAGQAWNSLQVLNHNVTLGWFIRAMHGWGSDFMVAIVLIHMVQVFLFGAYKFPRELTWVVGILLLIVTLGMAFTGQVLRFDQDAYWGLGIGASIASRVPILGPPTGRADHRGCDAGALFRLACVYHSRAAHLFRRRASADGPTTGNQRVANAGPRGPQGHLYKGLSRADQA